MVPYRFSTHPLLRALRRPWKILQAWAACVVFGFPSHYLRVVGVTGTTGKTTTIHLTVVALESAGYVVGAVSSLNVQIGTKRMKNESGLTSLGPWQLQRILRHMATSGCQYAVLEVSSHALDQRRFWGVRFDVAVITNLSRDHLDYHRTIEDYTGAKRELFRAVSARPPKVVRGQEVPRVLIASLDDPLTRQFLDEDADRRYGMTLLNPGTPRGTEPVYCLALRVLPEKTTSVVMVNGESALLHLRLAGWFNVRNALAAVAVGVSQGIPPARITRELYEVRAIPGRFERVDVGQPFQVIIDYAVTPAALETMYGAVQGLQPQRVLAVFGACGERDRGKRPEMARIVAKYADVVFLTNEDPFGEDPEQIFSDLIRGFREARCAVRRLEDLPSFRAEEHAPCVFVQITDRREAIRAAVRHARPGDIVVATGKGAEEWMRFKHGAVPWNERGVFEEEIRSL